MVTCHTHHDTRAQKSESNSIGIGPSNLFHEAVNGK